MNQGIPGVWLTPWRFTALLGVLVALSFPRVIAGLGAFAYLDCGQFAYPVALYQHEVFWRGELPLWNPLSNCGIPFLAQWNTQTLYPPSLFYLVFPMPWSFGVFCLLHLVLAGTGMYHLAARWTGNTTADGSETGRVTGNQLAAAVAGAVFAFNGFTWYAIMWPHILAALGWMPWVVLTTEQGWLEGGRKLALAAVVAGFQLLTGGAEVILLTWLFLGGLCCLHIFKRGSRWKQVVWRAVCGGCLAAGFAAPQLIPFLDLLAHSQRGTAYGSAEMGVMPPWGWANYLVPVFHCLKNPQGLFVPPNHWTGSYYLGAGIIGLAGMAVVRARNKKTWLLLGFAAFSLLMALGGPGRFYSMVTAVIPLLGFLRFPVKFVMLATFVLPLLAAFGLSWWLRPLPNEQARQNRLLLGVATGLLALIGLIVFWAYAFPLNATDFAATLKNGFARMAFVALIVACLMFLHRARTGGAGSWAVQLGLIAVLWLDVLTHNTNLSPTINPAALQPNAIRQFFGWGEQVAPGSSRVMQSPAAYQRMMQVGYTDLEVDTQGRRLSQFFNYNLLDFVPKVDGFYSLYPKEQHALIERVYNGTNGVRPLQDFLGVSFATDPNNIVSWKARASYMPFATAGQRVIFQEDERVLDAITSDQFDPQVVVYLPRDAEGRVRANGAVKAKTALSSYSPARIVLDVEAEGPTMVVLPQTYYHDWKATVNGQPAVVWRANYCFQAVEVPSGAAQVVISYSRRTLYIGLGIFSVAVLILLLMWFRSGKSVSTPVTAG